MPNLKTIERTVYTCTTQEANSTIKRVPGSLAIAQGEIDVFFPAVRNGRLNYRITDSTGKVTEIPMDSDWHTAEGVTVTLKPEGITDGRQKADVTTTGSIGLWSISVVLKDWETTMETMQGTLADHETRVTALEAKP